MYARPALRLIWSLYLRAAEILIFIRFLRDARLFAFSISPKRIKFNECLLSISAQHKKQDTVMCVDQKFENEI